MGGESRKSRRPFAASESNASANSRSAPWISAIMNKNTNLNRLTSPTARNSPNNLGGQGEPVPWRLTVIMSSENTGDVIVDNNSATTVGRWSPELATGAATWRDRRTLSGDRSRFPVHRQFKSVVRSIRNCLLAEPSCIPNRKVSKVSAHAPNRRGAQPADLCRSM